MTVCHAHTGGKHTDSRARRSAHAGPGHLQQPGMGSQVRPSDSRARECGAGRQPRGVVYTVVSLRQCLKSMPKSRPRQEPAISHDLTTRLCACAASHSAPVAKANSRQAREIHCRCHRISQRCCRLRLSVSSQNLKAHWRSSEYRRAGFQLMYCLCASSGQSILYK